MTRWKSIHPDLEIPEHLTTWQWAFESEKSAPTQCAPRKHLGRYVDAISKERLDFAAVKEKATHLSTALIHKYGLVSGDTVSLFANNSIWYPVAVWATVRAGGRVNGASPAYNAEEMAYAMSIASTKFLFTLPNSLPVALDAAGMVGLPRERVFLLEGSHKGHLSMQDLIAVGVSLVPEPPFAIPHGQSNKDVCGYLNFSSGTTGLPKAVMLSHHNIIAQCMQLRQVQVLPQGRRYAILAVMPLFHITGLVRFIHYPMLMNGDSVMLPAFNMKTMLQAIVDFQIEELILVPPILIRIVRDPAVDEFMPALSKIVKRWSSGSAPISPEIIEQLRKKFPNTGFRQGYGATESTACISCHPPTHFDYKYARTAGMLCANTEAKVVHLDDPTREIGVGETGEICARGPQIAMGYLGNPTATAETFDHEGFLHTGDVGHIDEDGMLHIEDRQKEMIKVKGQQVAPAELEDLLLGHPKVDDCAVLGVMDDYAGERPKAYVVVKQGIAADEALGRVLLASVREKKVRYKWLAEIEFTDAIPKSATGKLSRRVLRSQDRQSQRVRGLVVREGSFTRARL